MKKRIFFLMLLCLVIVSVVLFSYFNSKPPDIYLSGSSENWNVYINMVKNGITDIVVAPAKEFESPARIDFEIRDSHGNFYSEEMYVRNANSYNAKFPTVKLLYKNSDDLKCDITYSGFSDTIELS